MATRWRVLNKRRRRKALIAQEPAWWRCIHRWEVEYYGVACAKCGWFYAHGTAPWEQDIVDDGDYDDGEYNGDCWHCGGDGWVDGYEEDPLWFAPGELERCSSCGGSGRAKDMTIW